MRPHRARLGDQMLSALVGGNEHVACVYDAQIVKCETEIWLHFELLHRELNCSDVFFRVLQYYLLCVLLTVSVF